MPGLLDLLIGRSLCGRYRVDTILATGGMGSVCRAFDVRLGREVAVKVVTAVARDPDEAAGLRARFHREATAAARLRHPNVVTVHDFGTDTELGIDFLVMELLAGEDLAARMHRAGGALEVDEAVEILREAGMGLAAGHRAGMVHRDIKPANIYLVAEPGGWEVKVLDFGIAQVRESDGASTATRLTRFGAPHTPRYASPEQLAGGRALTPASDVFSLALTAVEMLAGEHPAGLNDTGDEKAAARFLRRLLQRRPEIPLRLAAVLRRSLRVDPAGRFPDAGALLDALDDWLHGEAASGPVAAGFASLVPSEDHTLIDDRAPPVPREPSARVPPPAAVGPRIGSPPFAPPPSPPIPFGAPAFAQSPAQAPMAQAAQAPAAPVAEQGAAAGAAPETQVKRRFRIRPAGWIVVVVLLLVAAITVAALHRPPRPARRAPGAPPTQVEAPPAEPGGGAAVARDEYERVHADNGPRDGDELFVVVLASVTPERMRVAEKILQDARSKGYAAGLANSAVYPELRDGYVVVVAGPYDGRAQAHAAVPDLRRDVAADAFAKRVTLRQP